MANKINGRTLVDALAEIKKPYEKNLSDTGKFKYIPIEEYESRMNLVLGSCYRTTYPEFKTFALSDTQFCGLAKCRIEFLDDESGTVVYSAEGWGTFPVPVMADKKEFINLNSFGGRTTINAFKAACNNLQIFGRHSTDEEDGMNLKDRSTPMHEGEQVPQTQNQSNDQPKMTNGVSKTNSVRVMSVFSTTVLNVTGTDNSGMPKYELGILLPNGVNGTVLFYSNQYKDCAAKVNELYSLLSDGMRHQLTLKLSQLKSDSTKFLFKGFLEE